MKTYVIMLFIFLLALLTGCSMRKPQSMDGDVTAEFSAE